MQNDVLEMKMATISFTTDREAVNEFVSKIGTVPQRPQSPTLSVSKITATSAVVALQSELDAKAVRFQLKFKKDEEKEEKWTEVDVQQNVAEHTLSGLVTNTGYVVMGRL